MKDQQLGRLPLSLALVLFASAAAFGQTAQVTGRVGDQAGAVVPGATITVTSARLDHSFGELYKTFGRFARNLTAPTQPDYFGNVATPDPGAVCTTPFTQYTFSNDHTRSDGDPQFPLRLRALAADSLHAQLRLRPDDARLPVVVGRPIPGAGLPDGRH